MQLCGPNYDSTHTFSVVVTSNATFTPIQDATRSWSSATCLSFIDSKTLPGKATFITPLLIGGALTNSTLASNSTFRARHATHSTSQDKHTEIFDNRAKFLQARADCRTVQVEYLEGCPELAVKCGISSADFTKYNSRICGTLMPKQHVCCSSGSLPDIRPNPNADGSCFSYQVQNDGNCAKLGAKYGLTNGELRSFNKDMWGWSGCEPLFSGKIMCLSKGIPPFLVPMANAVCVPQKPGSKRPTDGSKIADLNPCPLNPCCNIWGPMRCDQGLLRRYQHRAARDRRARNLRLYF